MYKLLKLGSTICVYNRDNTYKTGEIKCGKYILILKIYDCNI